MRGGCGHWGRTKARWSRLWSGYSARRRLLRKTRTTPQLRKPLRKNKPRLPPPVTGRRPPCQKDEARCAAANWVSGPGKPVTNMRFSKSNPGRGPDRRRQTYPVTTLANVHSGGKDLIRHQPDPTPVSKVFSRQRAFATTIMIAIPRAHSVDGAHVHYPIPLLTCGQANSDRVRFQLPAGPGDIVV